MGFDFTVVVPAYNESHFIEPTLQSIRAQDYSGSVELIVVDNNSSDDTAEVAHRYADRVIHYTDRQGASAARQHGGERAQGAAIAFIDADTCMSPNLLSEAARSLEKGAAGGRAPLRIDDRSFGAWWTEIVVNVWNRFIGPNFIPYVYTTRDVFRATGGWNLDVSCGEEVLFQRRVCEQGRLAWNPRGHTLTHARRYLAEGYYNVAAKGTLFYFMGVHFDWRPVRALQGSG